MLGLGGFAARFRDHPIAATIELGSFLGCFVLVVATTYAIAGGPPTGQFSGDLPWLLVIAGGGLFVVFWTLVVPLYERTL
ncbi:hypothetical protein ACLI4Y_12245 [Natrialbaceae archaeon A-CW3]